MSLVFLLFFIASDLVCFTTTSTPKVVCWYQASSTNTGLRPGDIEAHLCSTIIYGSADVSVNHTLTAKFPEVELTVDNIRGSYAKIVSLKEQNRDLRFLVSVGYDTGTRDTFNAALLNAASMTTFASSVAPFLEIHGFDGIDISWSCEFQGPNIYQDRQRLYDLLIKLRAALPKHLISVTLVSSTAFHYDLAEVSRLSDEINMIYHNTDCSDKACHKAFIQDLGNTADRFINLWLDSGVERSKMNLGIPLHGEKMKLTGGLTGLGSPASLVGQENYGVLCKVIEDKKFTILRIEPMGLPFAYKNNDWISYEDPVSAARRASLVMKHNLNGIFVYPLQGDDFKGICSQRRYPLITTIKKTFESEQDEQTKSKDHRIILLLTCVCCVLNVSTIFLVIIQIKRQQHISHIVLDVQDYEK